MKECKLRIFILMLAFISVGCDDNSYSERDIQMEAQNQLSFKAKCTSLATELNSTATMEISNQDGYPCYIKKKYKEKGAIPFFIFSKQEIEHISKYLSIKEIQDVKYNG